MAVTAKRNDMRLIAIVLGEKVSKVRNQETTDLLDYGFNLYKVQVIKKQGDIIKTLELDKATKNKIDVVLEKDITVLGKKNDTNKVYNEKVNINEIKLPLKEGQVVGNIEIYDQDNLVGSYPLVVKEEVKKKNIWNLFLDNLKDIIVGDLVF